VFRDDLSGFQELVDRPIIGILGVSAM